MSALDAAFLALEAADPNAGLHIGSVGVFEAPAPGYCELTRLVTSRLPLVPRYRQKVRTVPAALGRPVWVDDPAFRLADHVREVTLPPPGDEQQLRRVVGRVMSRRLDRRHPLWETWLVEGLDGGRWALISKVHHSLADGVSGTDLLTTMFDLTPEPAAPTVVPAWHPQPEPSSLRLLADAALGQATVPWAVGRTALGLLRDPVRAAAHAGQLARGLLGFGAAVRPVARTSLHGPIGPRRSVGWARGEFADARDVRRAFGGTVNDVVLAAVAGAFRSLLLSRTEEPASGAVRTLVPVSVRRPDRDPAYGNRVSAMLAELPVEVPDPVERLRAVQQRLRSVKASHEADAGAAVTAGAQWAPFELLAGGLRLAFGVPQWLLTTVTTNVPGPPVPLYVAGRRMLAAFPYVPIADRLRLGVAIFSYDGQLTFGVTADSDSVPDLGVFVAAIEEQLAELAKAAHERLAG